MKNINIELIHNNIKIGEVEFISLKSIGKILKLELDHIVFFNNYSIDFLLNKTILFKILLKEYYLMEFTSDFNYYEINDTKVVLNIKSFTTNKLHRFNQDYLDVFQKWDSGEVLNWEMFNNKKSKENWLRCCNIWSGVPTELDSEKEYYLSDNNNLRLPIDLHCFISKIFYGERGYFGSEYNSFIDCLINIEPSIIKNEKKPILIIEGYESIFQKFQNKSNYFLEVIKELEKSQIQVVFQS